MADYRVSKAAQKDIREIGLYTQREWGAVQRRKYLSGLEAQFETIAQNPFLAAERRELTPPVRILRHERHLIVFLIEDEGVLIVRVLHASMDVPAQLSDR
ncbi:MAG: type II toxin-antitoxin system RelE/ParE family toxin [Rickettsiales bacterium]|jgi:toxin ParE1/3/4